MTDSGLPRRFRLRSLSYGGQVAPRNDVKRASAISRRDAPEACMKPSPLNAEGAGNAGRTMRPQPRMQMKKAYERSHHGHTGFTRHSLRNGFTAYIVLSPAIGLSCHRRLRFVSQT
jgi:hypothetical protein